MGWNVIVVLRALIQTFKLLKSPKKIITGFFMQRKFSPWRLIGILLCGMSFLVSAERLKQPSIMQSSSDKVLLLSVAKSEQRLIASGEQGVIIYSDDDGLTWHQSEVPVSVLITDVHFFDNQSGWAVGHDGVLLRSLDQGASWQKQLDGSVINSLRVQAIENEVQALKKVTPSNDELLEETEYLLDDARAAQEEGPSTPLLDVHFISEQTGFAVGAYGLVLRSNDGGETWEYIGHKLPNPDGLHLNRIFYTQDGRLLLLGEAGLLLQSRDEGQNWMALDSPYMGSFYTAAESDSLYLMGLRGNTFKQTKNGWEKVSLPVTATINDAIVVDEAIYLVGQGGALLKQTKQGFEGFSERGLRSFSAVSLAGGFLIIVGEGGVKRVSLKGNK